MTMPTPPKLILASRSPRRHALLKSLGVEFEIQSADVDESVKKGETPLAYVRRVAKAKALKIHQENPECSVLAADTPVYIGRRIHQNPETPEEEREMLTFQSGKKVHIPTVVVLVTPEGIIKERIVRSWAKFKKFTPEEIEYFVAREDLWRGVSGGMKFDTPETQKLVKEVFGTTSAIQGLPLYETRCLLAWAGYNV